MICIMYKGQTDTLYEPVLFEPLKKLVSHAMFEVTCFIDFGPYLESFNSLEKCIGWLDKWLTDIVKNSNHS